MLIELNEDNQHVTIRRERPATKAERAIDREASFRTEVVTIRFHNDAEPEIEVNSDLCAK